MLICRRRQAHFRGNLPRACRVVENQEEISAAGFVLPEDLRLRLLIQTVLRLVAGAYFVLTSLYCLLAYLPYTYCAFIKAPPYPWMPWFTHHQASLYWLAAAAGVMDAKRWSWSNWRIRDLLPGGVLIAIGIYLSVRPFLAALQSTRAAYWWSLASLLPVIGFCSWRSSEKRANRRFDAGPASVGYSSGLLVSITVSTIYIVSTRLQVYRESQNLGLHSQLIYIALWSLVTHLAVAMAVLSGLNLIYFAASKTPKPAP